MRGFSQPNQAVEWWSSGREWGKRWVRLSSLPGRCAVWATGNRLGAVSCRAPEPLLGPPTGLGPGLEAVVNLSLWALAPTIWGAWGTWGLVVSWALCSLSDDVVQGLGTWPWRSCQLRSTSSARTQTSKGQSCAWGPWPSCQTGNNVCLVEIYRNIIPWPWPDLQNKGSDTKKFATANHTPLSPFLEKSFAEKFWATTQLLAGPYNIPFSVPNSEVLVCLASLCDEHRDLSFGITSTFIWLSFVKKICPLYLSPPPGHMYFYLLTSYNHYPF